MSPLDSLFAYEIKNNIYYEFITLIAFIFIFSFFNEFENMNFRI